MLNWYKVFGFSALIFSGSIIHAQRNVELRFMPLTWHPGGDEMAFLMPNRLDNTGTLVLNWGFLASYEQFLYKNRLSFKVTQAAISDCASLFSGHTHLGFRINVLNSQRHYLRFGWGPTVVYRRSWSTLEGYVPKTRSLRDNGVWQTAFTWYGCEVEYDYAINPRWDIAVGVVPGYPRFVSLLMGGRYWLKPREWKKKEPVL